jgi:hypothetical protein
MMFELPFGWVDMEVLEKLELMDLLVEKVC